MIIVIEDFDINDDGDDDDDDDDDGERSSPRLFCPSSAKERVIIGI